MAGVFCAQLFDFAGGEGEMQKGRGPSARAQFRKEQGRKRNGLDQKFGIITEEFGHEKCPLCAKEFYNGIWNEITFLLPPLFFLFRQHPPTVLDRKSSNPLSPEFDHNPFSTGQVYLSGGAGPPKAHPSHSSPFVSYIHALRKPSPKGKS